MGSPSTTLAPCLGRCKGAPTPASACVSTDGMPFMKATRPSSVRAALDCPSLPHGLYIVVAVVRRCRCWFSSVHSLGSPSSLFPIRSFHRASPQGVSFTRLAVAVLSFFLFPYPPYVHFIPPGSLIDAGLVPPVCFAVVRLACLPPFDSNQTQYPAQYGRITRLIINPSLSALNDSPRRR